MIGAIPSLLSFDILVPEACRFKEVFKGKNMHKLKVSCSLGPRLNRTHIHSNNS